MKLIPLLLVFLAAYFCGALRDRFQPTPTPTPPPTPVANAPERVNPDSNKSVSGPPAPKMISGGDLNDKAKTLPQPEYPKAARAVRASGEVKVQVVIDEDGKVVSVQALSGHPLLRVAAEQAARKAEFAPTLLSGTPVKVSGTLTYSFQP